MSLNTPDEWYFVQGWWDYGFGLGTENCWLGGYQDPNEPNEPLGGWKWADTGQPLEDWCNPAVIGEPGFPAWNDCGGEAPARHWPGPVPRRESMRRFRGGGWPLAERPDTTTRMCGRYTLISPGEELAEVFEFSETRIVWKPRYNIAPTQPAPVVRTLEKGDRRLGLLRWGLIPSWADDPAMGNRMINARSETAATRPAFRAALRRRRCLVPATGFYEWQRAGRRKQPFYVRMRDGRVFALGGLWERWRSPGGEEIDSYTILTTEPNELVRPLHDRMPVVIAHQDFALWLDTEVEDPKQLKPLLRPCPSDEMVAHPVGTRVNSPANDDPACIEPLEGP